MDYQQIFAKLSFFGVTAVTAGVIFTAQPSYAAVTNGPFGLQGGAVSDAELSAMRGRFVEGRDVTFFGVVMRTDWGQSGGHDFTMEMHINIDMSQQRFKPRMTMYHSRDIGERNNHQQEAAGLENVTDNGALESISGVVQNIQVAGDSNTVHNDVQWTVTDNSEPMETAPEALVELSSSGTQSHTNGDGVTTQVSVDAEGIGYQVDVPEVGSVSQRITKTQLSGGSILQSTQLDSNLNQVLNQIGLTVELSPARSLPAQSRDFHRALGNLRGL